ncbi:hypothetical protein [Dictyobacter kobayashii]|uniref:Uncharacterized protein n=1 Tax=Dictyobacter kobayashii TaxID=2014872 RepID=A0A402AY54_9CHLR|nr:hypothetical protein [Dictyobacter kobayashii]GCE24018.1 hypothetical protein KDK_78180 [Dictyobacter kobayashii]
MEFFPRESRDKLVFENPIMGGGMGNFDDTFRNRINAFVTQVLQGGPWMLPVMMGWPRKK